MLILNVRFSVTCCLSRAQHSPGELLLKACLTSELPYCEVNLLHIQVSPDLVQCKSRLLMYYKRQCRTLAYRNRNQSNQPHMSNLVEIDISHERILRHSLEFGTVLGYFLTVPLQGLTVVLTGLVPTENHESRYNLYC